MLLKLRRYSAPLFALVFLALLTGAGVLLRPAHADPAEDWGDLRAVITSEITHAESRQYLLSRVDVLETYEQAQNWDAYEVQVTFFTDELIRLREDVGSITVAQEVAVYDDFSAITHAYVVLYNTLDVTESRVVQSRPNERCQTRSTATCATLVDRICDIKAEFRNNQERNRRCETR